MRSPAIGTAARASSPTTRPTMRAVSAYQVKNKLPRTGAVDTLTRAALVSDGVLKN